MMNRLTPRCTAIALMSALLVAAAACSSDKKSESSELSGRSTTTAAVRQGEAGGVLVDTFTASATVTAIDRSSRKVTLTGDDGSKSTFTAGPEIRNFNQLHVTDRMNATIVQKLVVFVRRGDAPSGNTAASAMAVAPEGAKPGVMVADAVELVATVKSIDTTTRDAVLEFSGGQSRVVKVRPDVDLTKYQVGDKVVIQMTQTLTVLVRGT